jgi:hypothetical protein
MGALQPPRAVARAAVSPQQSELVDVEPTRAHVCVCVCVGGCGCGCGCGCVQQSADRTSGRGAHQGAVRVSSYWGRVRHHREYFRTGVSALARMLSVDS